MSDKRPTGLLLLEGFIVCDLIRTEDNRKLLFVGCYNDVITAQAFPLTMTTLSFGFKVRVIEQGDYSVEFELHDPDDQTLAKASGLLKAAAGVAWLPLTIAQVILPRPGGYKAILAIGDNPPTTFKFEAVKIVPSSTVAMKEPAPN